MQQAAALQIGTLALLTVATLRTGQGARTAHKPAAGSSRRHATSLRPTFSPSTSRLTTSPPHPTFRFRFTLALRSHAKLLSTFRSSSCSVVQSLLLSAFLSAFLSTCPLMPCLTSF